MIDWIKSGEMNSMSPDKLKHWLYDDADLSKYTMPMTRSEHTTMHHRMRADGYEVPHINSVTDDNGLWGYR